VEKGSLPFYSFLCHSFRCGFPRIDPPPPDRDRNAKPAPDPLRKTRSKGPNHAENKVKPVNKAKKAREYLHIR